MLLLIIFNRVIFLCFHFIRMKSKSFENVSPFATKFFWTLQIMALSISLLVNLSMITWIQKLEKIECECSEDWKRQFILYAAYFFAILSIITFVMNVIYFVSNKTAFKVNEYVSGLLVFFNLVNLMISIIYVYNLRNNECKCSEDIRRDYVYYYNWARLILLAFVFIAMVAYLYLIYKVLK